VIAVRFPRANQWNLYEAVGDDGESLWELFLRAGRAVQSIFTLPPGDYLVVSHGGLLNQVVHVALGIFPQTHLHATRFRFHNTGYAILQYNIDRQSWLVECINEHGHWKPRS
jgi:broad specificity phosphatase PhoE